MTLPDESLAGQTWQRRLDASGFPVAQTRPATGPAIAPPDRSSAADSHRHPRPHSRSTTVQFRPPSDAAARPSHHREDEPEARAETPSSIRAYRAATRAEKASTQPWRKP